MSSNYTPQMIAKAEEFIEVGVKHQVELYRKNKDCQELYLSVLGSAFPGFTSVYPTPLYRFFLEMHDPHDRTCCPDQTQQGCIRSASQKDVFIKAPYKQQYKLIYELKDSEDAVTFMRYLPENQQAQIFSGFQDWERRDLSVYDREGTEELLKVCAKVQEAEKWYSDGKICVATNNFPKTRTCSGCKEEFKAGMCGVISRCNSHIFHDRCLRQGIEYRFGKEPVCKLCKENK